MNSPIKKLLYLGCKILLYWLMYPLIVSILFYFIDSVGLSTTFLELERPILLLILGIIYIPLNILFVLFQKRKRWFIVVNTADLIFLIVSIISFIYFLIFDFFLVLENGIVTIIFYLQPTVSIVLYCIIFLVLNKICAGHDAQYRGVKMPGNLIKGSRYFAIKIVLYISLHFLLLIILSFFFDFEIHLLILITLIMGGIYIPINILYFFFKKESKVVFWFVNMIDFLSLAGPVILCVYCWFISPYPDQIIPYVIIPIFSMFPYSIFFLILNNSLRNVNLFKTRLLKP
jgi:hypothetical protein